MSLPVVDYNRISDRDKAYHCGFIAQDVQPIFPHLIRTTEARPEITDEDGNITQSKWDERLSMYKIGLIPIIVKAMQELSAKVEALENA